jgi:hypothetical protein
VPSQRFADAAGCVPGVASHHPRSETGFVDQKVNVSIADSGEHATGRAPRATVKLTFIVEPYRLVYRMLLS